MQTTTTFAPVTVRMDEKQRDAAANSSDMLDVFDLDIRISTHEVVMESSMCSPQTTTCNSCPGDVC